MTSNQIAFHKLQEEERKNKMSERQRGFEIANQAKQAEAARQQSLAARQSAYAQYLDAMAKQGSYEPDWSKAFGSITRGIGSIIPW